MLQKKKAILGSKRKYCMVDTGVNANLPDALEHKVTEEICQVTVYIIMEIME